MTLNIHLGRQGAAAFLAYYADGGNGAKKPYGQGYGGNESGQTDASGNKTFTWTLAPQTPLGPARVDIYAAVEDLGQGFKSVPFKVAGIGSC